MFPGKDGENENLKTVRGRTERHYEKNRERGKGIFPEI